MVLRWNGHSRPEPRLAEQFGVDSRVVQGNRRELAIGDMRVEFWRWNRETQEACLRRAGLDEIHWHPLEVHPEDRELRVRARINAHSWASRRPYGKAREVNNI